MDKVQNQEKRLAKSAEKGKGEEAGGADLEAREPRPPLGRSRPQSGQANRTPGRIGVRAGHNYTSAPGEDLKPSGGDCSLEARPPRSSEGGQARAQEPFTRHVGTRKQNQNKLLSSIMGNENKSCLLEEVGGRFEIQRVLFSYSFSVLPDN